MELDWPASETVKKSTAFRLCEDVIVACHEERQEREGGKRRGAVERPGLPI
jgi:hypothetical protein